MLVLDLPWDVSANNWGIAEPNQDAVICVLLWNIIVDETCSTCQEL